MHRFHSKKQLRYAAGAKAKFCGQVQEGHSTLSYQGNTLSAADDSKQQTVKIVTNTSIKFNTIFTGQNQGQGRCLKLRVFLKNMPGHLLDLPIYQSLVQRRLLPWMNSGFRYRSFTIHLKLPLASS